MSSTPPVPRSCWGTHWPSYQSCQGRKCSCWSLWKSLKFFCFSATQLTKPKNWHWCKATGHRSVQGSVVMSWNSETTRSLKRRSVRSRPNLLVDEIKRQMSFIKRCRNSSKSSDWTILYVARRRLELVSQQKMRGLLKDSMPAVRYQSILRLHSPAFSVGAYRCSGNSARFQTSSYGSGIVAQDEDLFESSQDLDAGCRELTSIQNVLHKSAQFITLRMRYTPNAKCFSFLPFSCRNPARDVWWHIVPLFKHSAHSTHPITRFFWRFRKIRGSRSQCGVSWIPT